MQPLVVADVTRGTGRYNFSLGAVGMIAGIGVTISTIATGFLVEAVGFTIGFTALAAAAALGIAAIWLLMPETVEAAHAD